MRVLTFTNLYPNEQQPLHGLFVERRVNALAAQGRHQVQVVAPIPYFPKFVPIGGRWKQLQQIPARETRQGLKIYHPRYFNPPKVGMSRYGQWMARGSRQILASLQKNGFPFDVIDAHFVYPDGLAALHLGQYFNRPVVVTARGSDITRNKHFPPIRPLLSEVMKGAAQLIAVSEALRDDFVELGAAPDKIQVIPNGINTEDFYPVPRDTACQCLKLNAADRWFVAVGRMDRNKGQWLILEALHKIGQAELQSRRIKLALIGDGEDRIKLQSLTHSYGLQAVVHFTGQLEPAIIRNWLNAADAMILASSREGSPNVVLEALACGTPVIATRAGRNAAVIDEGQSGLLIPVGNVEALQAAIMKSLNQDWNREQIAERGRQRDWASVAKEVEAVLLRACQEYKNQ